MARYTALVLTDESHNKLISAFRNEIPSDWEVIAHHMTINMGNIKPEWATLLGAFSDLLVTDFAMNEKVAAVKVKTDVPTVNDTPHITVAVNRRAGGKPVMSNNLKNWAPIEEPFLLRGRVEEV